MATGSGTGTPIAAPSSTSTTTPDRSAPLLPLDEWRRIIGWNPWHFWGFSNATLAPTSACNSVVKQYAWQGTDAAGRADVLDAIQTAEDKLRLHLGFSVAPRYELDDVTWPRSNNMRATRLWSADAAGRWVNVHVKNGYVKQLGIPARALIGNATVVFHDYDNDGLNEAFTLSIGTTVTDVSELAVYFKATERFDGSGVSERWRVQPLQISIASGTATITGRTWTIGKPALYEGVSSADIDPTNAANFPTELAVYRYYTDTTDQGLFVWESAPGACCDESSDPSSYYTANARYTLRDAALGYVGGEAATYNTTTALWEAACWDLDYEPTFARVSYLAGSSLENAQMSGRYKAIVARLAAAELSRRICACDAANHELHRWQFEMSRAAGANDEQYQISEGDLSNPLGTRGGQIWAWKQVKSLAQMGASLP